MLRASPDRVGVRLSVTLPLTRRRRVAACPVRGRVPRGWPATLALFLGSAKEGSDGCSRGGVVAKRGVALRLIGVGRPAPAIALAVLVLLAWFMAPASASAVTYWGPARAVDTAAPYDDPAGTTGMSCPTRSFCVAVGLNSHGGSSVFTSSNPTGGARFWHRLEIPGIEMARVSCPTASFCVTVGHPPDVDGQGASEIATSTHPTGGASAWKADDHRFGALVQRSGWFHRGACRCLMPVDASVRGSRWQRDWRSHGAFGAPIFPAVVLTSTNPQVAPQPGKLSQYPNAGTSIMWYARAFRFASLATSGLEGCRLTTTVY